jgi:hypothetical protein
MPSPGLILPFSQIKKVRLFRWVITPGLNTVLSSTRVLTDHPSRPFPIPLPSVKFTEDPFDSLNPPPFASLNSGAEISPPSPPFLTFQFSAPAHASPRISAPLHFNAKTPSPKVSFGPISPTPPPPPNII